MVRSRYSKLLVVMAVGMCSTFFVGCPSQDVIVIDDLSGISLEKVWDDMVSFFTGKDAPFDVGDIIVGSEGGGFLRRVLGVDKQDGKLLTETEMCSLAEAIEDGALSGTVAFTPEDFAKAGAPLAKAGDVTVDLSGLVLYNKDGIKVSVASGTLTYAPTVTLNASFKDHKLASFNAITAGDLAISLRMRVEATGNVTLSKEWMLFTISKPFVFYIGPVPVAGTATFNLPLGIVGTVNGGAAAEAGFDATTYVTLGATFANDKWTNVSDFGQFEPVAQPATLSFSSGAGLDFYLKPNAGLNLYGVSDLTGFVQPYLAADAQFVPSPFLFVLTAGINGGIGYELGIFDFNLIDKDWYFPGPQWELYRYEAPYDVPTTFTFNLP